MESKNHTPAPWKVVSVFVNNAPNEIHISTGKWEKPSVAIVGKREDANLIAAAPELLDALERLFEHTAMVHNRWGEGDNTKEADLAIQDARAAIAKARGQS